MALTKTITLDSGLQVPDAYIRVDTVSGSRSGLDCTANIYISELAFRGRPGVEGVEAVEADEANGIEAVEAVEAVPEIPAKPFVERVCFHFVPDVSDDAPNFIRQAYLVLLSQPRFAGAVDA